MAERKTRRCAVCQREYKFCPICKEDKEKESWYFTFCSDNCHDLYKVMADFENGLISDVMAKEQLSKLDLSKRDSFGESYQKSFKKIMKSKMPVKKAGTKEENENVELISTNKSIVTKIKKETEVTLNSDF